MTPAMPTTAPRPTGRLRTVLDFATVKAAGTKIAMVTCYDAWSAKLLATTSIDCLLVGDSAMMINHGDRDTLLATTELMAMHTRSVTRAAPELFVTADMPFLTGRKGKAFALDCACMLVQAGAHAVKIEGARGHIPVISHLVESGIPVMGHLGLTPQWVRGMGGHKVQARTPEEAATLRDDAHALQEAGAFSLVLECIPQALARDVTKALRIPTIGIGAGAGCDGQVLVLHDLLGLNPEFKPRFARRFADGDVLVRSGIARFAQAVRAGDFPTREEGFEP